MVTHRDWLPSTKEWKASYTREDTARFPHFLRAPEVNPFWFPYHILQAGREECAGVSCSCSSCASGSGPSSRPAADPPPARRTRRWCRWWGCSHPPGSSGACPGSSTRMLAWGQQGNLSAHGHGPHNTSGDTSVTCSGHLDRSRKLLLCAHQRNQELPHLQTFPPCLPGADGSDQLLSFLLTFKEGYWAVKKG